MPKERTMAPQRTIISMPPELKERISVFRHASRISTEAEAIRQLLSEALDARGVPVEASKTNP